MQLASTATERSNRPASVSETDAATRVWRERLAPDVEIHAESRGEGPPLLMLHGLGSTSFTWRHIAPQLARTHEVISIDLKGFGCSSKPDDGCYSMRDQAELAAAFIEKLGLDDVTLVGSSMGGGVALSLAVGESSEVAQRLKALVLLGTVAYAQPLPFYLNLIHRRLVGERTLGLVPPEVIIRKILEFGFHDKAKIDACSVAAYADALRTRHGRSALVAATRQLIPEDVDEVTARYAEIALPVLIISGVQDRVIPEDVGRRLDKTLPSSRLVRLENCGHLPQEECPEAVMQLFKTFLSELGIQ